MKQNSILIAGIGNIFWGDDGFGVEVIRKLQQRQLPAGVVAADFGIRGFDLACALGDYETVILVDTVQRGGTPGSIYVIEPDISTAISGDPPPLFEGHMLHPAQVLQYLQLQGQVLPRLRLVGCEPQGFGSAEEPQLGLSPAVAQAVEAALSCIGDILSEFTSEAAQLPVA